MIISLSPQIYNVDIESDSQLVCQTIQANEEYFSSNATMTFVKLSANSDAHSIARTLFSMSGLTVWRDVTPLFLNDVLDNDLKE